MDEVPTLIDELLPRAIPSICCGPMRSRLALIREMRQPWMMLRTYDRLIGTSWKTGNHDKREEA